MKNSKFKNVHGRTVLNNGIHAASANNHVSERTGMSVVPRSSDVFAQQKLAVSKCTRMYVC